jgi:hypothetical protein
MRARLAVMIPCRPLILMVVSVAIRLAFCLVARQTGAKLMEGSLIRQRYHLCCLTRTQLNRGTEDIQEDTHRERVPIRYSSLKLEQLVHRSMLHPATRPSSIQSAASVTSRMITTRGTYAGSRSGHLDLGEKNSLAVLQLMSGLLTGSRDPSSYLSLR